MRCDAWCQRRDLNPRPRAYESPALPLSYSGEHVLVKTVIVLKIHLMFDRVLQSVLL